MAKKNLWGDIGNIAPPRTPTTVLKEQAAQLTLLTKGVLRGDVSSGMRYGDFTATLSIVAPAVGDYEFTVAHLQYGMDLYPAKLVAERNARDGEVTCENEEELTAQLEEVLTSDRVRKVIAALIAQSRS